jgi:hypothetical protein
VREAEGVLVGVHCEDEGEFVFEAFGLGVLGHFGGLRFSSLVSLVRLAWRFELLKHWGCVQGFGFCVSMCSSGGIWKCYCCSDQGVSFCARTPVFERGEQSTSMPNASLSRTFAEVSRNRDDVMMAK